MGLVQRELEAAGFSTITLSPMGDVTAAFGVPRLAAIERPFSQTVGRPEDAAAQRQVLWSVLEALASIPAAGGRVDLDFPWHESRAQAIKHSHPRRAPPVTDLIKRKPWLMVKFLKGELPKPG